MSATSTSSSTTPASSEATIAPNPAGPVNVRCATCQSGNDAVTVVLPGGQIVITGKQEAATLAPHAAHPSDSTDATWLWFALVPVVLVAAIAEVGRRRRRGRRARRVADSPVAPPADA